MTAPKSQLTFKLKTLFMGSDGTIPEQYARTTEKRNLPAWIAEGLIEHRPTEKIYALTRKRGKSHKVTRALLRQERKPQARLQNSFGARLNRFDRPLTRTLW